eukprot:1158672-Pelagomonas_calceolata.AAC.6
MNPHLVTPPSPPPRDLEEPVLFVAPSSPKYDERAAFRSVPAGREIVKTNPSSSCSKGLPTTMLLKASLAALAADTLHNTPRHNNFCCCCLLHTRT